MSFMVCFLPGMSRQLNLYTDKNEIVEKELVQLRNQISEANSAEKIEQLSEVLAEYPQLNNMQTDHFKLTGLYMRKVVIEKGQIIVGKIHKKEHFVVIAKGKFGVSTNHGVQQIYEAGDIIVSDPDVQRVVVGLETGVFLTVHRTDAETLEQIKDDLMQSPKIDLYDANNMLKDPQLAYERRKELK
ncbi:MAG: hypothetical protein ACJ8R9_10930 [Steroidobacteraceae bacterium]